MTQKTTPHVHVQNWHADGKKGSGLLLITNTRPMKDNVLVLVQDKNGVVSEDTSHWSSTASMYVAIEFTADQTFFLRIREDGEDVSYAAATFALREGELCLVREVKGVSLLLPEKRG